MLITRYAKIVMALGLAVFCLLVAFDNITDYGTNFLFVKHVLSMDTTYPGNALMYRSITSPALWTLCYWLIIAGEAIAGILLLAGTIRLWQVRLAPGAVFNAAKGLVVAGVLAAFLVWFVGFMVVAGEWFAMWQSATWNGQEPAFRFYVTALAVLIFVNQPDGDLAAPAEPAQPSADTPAAKAKAAPAKKAVKKAPPAKKRAPARRRSDKGRRSTDTA
jgi:predicted small integral membrane protein